MKTRASFSSYRSGCPIGFVFVGLNRVGSGMPLPLYLGLSREEHSGASSCAVFPERQVSGLSFKSHERMITGSNRMSPELFPHGSAGILNPSFG
jgi:hypothetical protein